MTAVRRCDLREMRLYKFEQLALILVDVANFHRTSTRLRYRAKHWLGRRPRLYHWIYRWRDGYVDRLVTDETDLCIEGFPRSANSFAVGAFEYAQDEKLSIAHHNHVPAPILNAVQRGLPTVVLIRDPVEAVISFRALQLQTSDVSGTPSPQLALSYPEQLRAWTAFYERIEFVREQVVVAPFERVIDDFGAVIDVVNERFGTAFARFEHTDATVETIRGSRGYHALPSERRDALKAQARERFEAEVGSEHPAVKRARALHGEYVDGLTGDLEKSE